MVSKILDSIFIASQLCATVAVTQTVTLNNGIEMPLMTLGCGTLGNLSETEDGVRLAYQVGFTAFDTAFSYPNQGSVGRALADMDRSSFFLTTKIGGDTPESFAAVGIASAYDHSLEEANVNLERLNFDYVDLVLIHYPPTHFGGFSAEDGCTYMQEQWRALEDFMGSGKTRAIGVANFCPSDLTCILETAHVVPAVNQLEFHVGMGTDPRGLVSHNDALGIKTMAFSPLGGVDYSHGIENATRDISLIIGDFTRGIGEPYGKTGAQVALRWLIQHGVPLATSTTDEKHLRQDLEVFEFNLGDIDMQQLDGATAPAAEPNNYYEGVPACGAVGFVTTV